MPKQQQIEKYEGWITRTEAAIRLSTDVSSIRRLEGKTLHPVKVPRGQRQIWVFDPDEVDDATNLKAAEPNVGSTALMEACAALVRQVQEMRVQDQAHMAVLLEAGIQDREASRTAAKDVLVTMSDALKAKDEREKALQVANDNLLEASRTNVRENHEMKMEEVQAEQAEKRKNEAWKAMVQTMPLLIQDFASKIAGNPKVQDFAAKIADNPMVQDLNRHGER